MKVAEIMTRNPACCSPETPLREVAKMMVEHDTGFIPVCDRDQKAIGTITDRDIVCRAVAEGRNPLELRARDCMTESAVTVREDMTVEECVDLLEEHQIRRAIVADESGRSIGVVAQADIARHDRDLAGEVVEGVSKDTGASAPLH